MPRKTAALLSLPWALLVALAGPAHLPAQGTASTAAPVASLPASTRADILAYIDTGWDRLSRSTADCTSVIDPKVKEVPILYLPFGLPLPPAVQALQAKCHVRVEHLPRAMTAVGQVSPGELPAEGLLYLPKPYVVPGGRFNEMYGWDSYFILLGLLDSGRDDLARGVVENFFFEIEHYGALLNANRTYFLTRSQPPLLSSMIRAVYERNAAGAIKPLPKVWLARAYALAERDHALWTSPIHTLGHTGLARYHDIGAGPVPEMADDSEYYPDVIRWLLAHPEAANGFLLNSVVAPTPAEQTKLKTTSCDIAHSRVCARAVVNGHRLTAAFYEGDRAMRESGFDTSFRFGPFSGATEDYAPVCLNSLLYRYETDLAYFAEQLGLPAEAAHWKAVAEARRAAINRYLWNAEKGFFFDWNARTKTQSTYPALAGFYPLWAGLATAAQAKAAEAHLPSFERSGGLANSGLESGTQWDMPYGWAPTNWLAVEGLERYGYREDARRIAHDFSETVLENFRRDGTLREKYNVVSGSANVAVAAGYKANVIGFGWTNGVYLQMLDLLEKSESSAPTGRPH